MKLRWLGALYGLVLAALLAAGLTLSSGAFAKDKPIEAKPGTGLAFGHFDLSDSEVAVDSVHLIRVKPRKILFYGFGMRPWESGTVTYTNGEFFSPNLKPGTYIVAGFRSGNIEFSLDDAFHNTFEVEAGRLAYAGTFKLRAKGARFLRRPKGSFERVDSPQAEVVLLRWLSQELAGSGWAPVVNARLSPPGPTN